MLKHYISIAIRNLRKNFGQNLIKITGLTAGLAACVIIFVFVKFELSYDIFHREPERIQRIVFQTRFNQGDWNSSLLIPDGIVPLLSLYSPEVESITRFSSAEVSIEYEDKKLGKINAIYADSNFFEVFSFTFPHGQNASFPINNNSIFLTESFAKKVFGKENPIGKTIEVHYWNTSRLYQITQLLKDVPSTSHFHFDMLAPAKLEKAEESFSWKFYGTRGMVYMRLPSSHSPASMQKKLDDFVISSGGDTSSKKLTLQPLLDIHLKSNYPFELEINGRDRDVILISAIAVLILLVGCLNFLLVTSAEFSSRIKEMGIRRVSGALQKDILIQFLIEIGVILIISFPLAILLSYFLLPLAASFLNRSLQVELLFDPLLILLVVFLFGIILILLGVFPTFLTGKISIANALKNQLTKAHSSKKFRKSLLTFQLVFAAGLFICISIMSRQTRFIHQKDLGFEKSHKLIVSVPFWRSASTLPLKNEVLMHPSVLNATYTGWLPGNSRGGSARMEHPHKEGSLEMIVFYGDEDLLETFGIHLVKGKAFSAFPQNDSSALPNEKTPIIINEALEKSLGLENIIGRELNYSALQGTVIGVIKDFHYTSLYDPMQPMVYRYDQKSFLLAIDYIAGKEAEVLANVRKLWETHGGAGAMDYYFVEDYLNNLYVKEIRLFDTIFFFTGLTIVLVCLAVFGQAMFSATRRQQEIGIRKILGANVGQILLLLNKEFLLIVLIGFGMAIPVAYWLMKDWLSGFVYHIDPDIGDFALSLGITGAIVFLTVTLRSLAIARRNPAKSLRTE
ncbi:MAG: ABC transporter permease [Bacteroidetes bacterium]|nr:ABC transporter permease [Bacteroidota bacterium]MCB0842600.1 ABC transporter permease [Bacteroidota bacterium]